MLFFIYKIKNGMVGIYRIRNIVNGHCYYGSSKNIEKRWKTHISRLNCKTHHSCILQNAWIKWGEDNFKFEVVELCEEEKLFEIEQTYLDENPIYNIGKTASGGDNLTNNPNRDDIIERITNSVIEMYENMSDDEKKEKHSKPMEKNPNWKGGVTYNYCKCGKRISYNAKTCKKCGDQSGENNPFYGKHHTDENKKYLHDIFSGKKNDINNKEIIINGKEYRSYTDAGIELNMCWGTIRHRCLSLNPKYKDYNIKGVEKIPYTKEELKIRHGKSKIGKKVYSNNKPFFIDDIEYRTLGDASNALGLHKSTIKTRILSKRPEFSNYRYK